MPTVARTALVIYAAGAVLVFIAVALFFILGFRKPNPQKNPEEYEEWKYMAPEERWDFIMGRRIGIFILAPIAAIVWPAFPVLVLVA